MASTQSNICFGVICMPGGSGKSTLCKKYPNILFDIDDIWDSNGSIESEMTKQWLEAKEENDDSERAKLENKCVLYKAQKYRELYQTHNLQKKVVLAQSHQQAQILLNNRQFEPRNNWNTLSKDFVDFEIKFVDTNKEIHLYPSDELHLNNLMSRKDPQWIIEMCIAQKKQLQSFGMHGNNTFIQIECGSHSEIEFKVLEFCRLSIENYYMLLVNILQDQYNFIPILMCFDIVKIMQLYLCQT